LKKQSLFVDPMTENIHQVLLAVSPMNSGNFTEKISDKQGSLSSFRFFPLLFDLALNISRQFIVSKG
jgi:hypothetical protein